MSVDAMGSLYKIYLKHKSKGDFDKQRNVCIMISLLEVQKFIINYSGQIIATSHDLTPNGGLLREFPFFQGNLGW